jgi:hypothetical protein
MLKGRCDVNLGKEALGPEYGGELGEKDLHGDFSSVSQVFGEVDRRHSAFAELALDAVAVG